MNQQEIFPLVEIRRYSTRPDAEIAAWALRAGQIKAQLRGVDRSVPGERGGSALLVPREDVERAREILSTDRFRISDDETSQQLGTSWAPASPEDIERGLAEIERRARAARYWRWSGLLVAASGLLGASAPLFAAIILAWFAGVGLTQLRVRSSDCPRCGLPYFRAPRSLRAFGAIFSRSCVACELEPG